MPRRFLTLADVSEILNVSATQAYALVRRGEIRAIQVGGRGQWRVEHDEVERYIASRYEAAAREFADGAAPDAARDGTTPARPSWDSAGGPR